MHFFFKSQIVNMTGPRYLFFLSYEMVLTRKRHRLGASKSDGTFSAGLPLKIHFCLSRLDAFQLAV